MDPISKWLIITRSCVFPMTLISALIGSLLGAIDGHFNLLYFILVALGLVLAHAANNMVNDYFDFKTGVDTSDYPRAKYSPHPILSGLVSEKKLILGIFICLLIDLIIAIYLTSVRGFSIMGLAVLGLAISVFYVAPPLKLKGLGMGEIAIFLIWGPMMIGGTYYVMTGAFNSGILFASIPYGLAVTSVILGKHLDKAEKDRAKQVKTLPVLLGDKRARLITQIVVMAFYLIISALAVNGILPILSLLALLSLPQAIRFISVLSGPIPDTPSKAFEVARDVIPMDLMTKFDPNIKEEDIPQLKEEDIPLWPLWYVVWGVWWTRIAGGLFVLGLVVQTVVQLIF